MRGRDLVYLDNGATSLKPSVVIDAIREYYSSYSANIHRGVYEMSDRATIAYDEAREAAKNFLDVRGKGEVLFTSGSTASINMVAFSWATSNLKRGDEIIITPMEHHSNLVPWQQVQRSTGAELRFFELTPEGAFADGSIEKAVTERTRLIAVTGMSNVTGYVPPHAEILNYARAKGIPVLIDGAQMVAHMPVSVSELDVDFLSFSAHKMCGPTGAGGIYVRSDRLAEMQPYQFGGDMIQTVSRENASWAGIPERFEAGTPNIAGTIGFGAAVRYLSDIGMDRIAAHEHTLGEYLHTRLAELPYIQMFGIGKTGIASFNMKGVHPHDVGSLLDRQGIAVRTGFHCAQPFMNHFGVKGTVRASIYLYNTEKDVDRLIEGLHRVHDIFG